MSPHRTTKDIRAIRDLYEQFEDRFDDIRSFSDGTIVGMPIEGIRIGPRLDRLVEHDWVQPNYDSGTMMFTISGFCIATRAMTDPDAIEKEPAPYFIEKAGSRRGVVLK